MWSIKLTSKRQATFPAQVCEELHLRPGVRLRLERGVVGGKAVFFIRPPEPDLSWVGIARKYAKGKSHRMSNIRRSIGRGIGETRKR